MVRQGFQNISTYIRQRRWSQVLLGLVFLAVALVALAYLVPLPERLNNQASTVIYFRDGVPMHVFLSPDEKWRVRLRLRDVDRRYIEALIRIEDKRFWYHPGVDPIAILRAAATNIRYGRVVAGGSTITMQLVRLLEPRPRTLTTKLIEALRAIQLELRLTKTEILEAYLQYAPYGRNIEGIEAAALSYFGHRARALSPVEIATLLAVPQNPNRRYPSTRNRQRLFAARNNIIIRMRDNGSFYGKQAVTAKQAMLVQVPDRLRPFPRHAPHAAYWLKGRYPGREHIYTTLDQGQQRFVQNLLTSVRRYTRLQGIHNGVVILVDHQRAEVRALAGNFDYWDDSHGGQIIGFNVARSPGSLLKPFIYAFAIDKGMVLPEYLVPDIPVEYSGYAPQNYDGKFRGLVRLEEALSKSLNLPFVNLLRQIHLDTFLGNLRTMGVDHLHPEPGHYGLSAAIGGIELTPLEIAGLYTTLASGGMYRPLTLLRTPAAGRKTSDRPAIKIFSAGAGYLTKRALSLKDRPDFPSRREVARMPPYIHWKTGTSFGHRDAWAAGSGPRYTAVVWLGNFDNTPSAELVGAEAAGPILFDVLEAVSERHKPVYADLPPDDLKEIIVCAYSGYLPTPACPRTKKVLALINNIPTKLCPFHIRLDIDIKTGLALTPNCRDNRQYRTETYTVWPASIRRWLKDRYRRLPQVPSLAPGCRGSQTAAAPKILSPRAGSEVYLVAGLPVEKQEIALEADSKRINGRLSWFINGRFLGTINADGRLWWTPRPGRHVLLVMDDLGQIDKQILIVHASAR